MSGFFVKLLCVLAPFVVSSCVASLQSFHQLECWHAENKADTSSQSGVLVKDLPCAARLSEPCQHSERMGIRTKSSVMDFMEKFFAVLSFYTDQVKDKILEISSSHRVCDRYGTTTLANVPTMAELKDMTTEQALRRVHHSLLAHLEKTLISDFKLNYTNARCFKGDEERQAARNQTFELATGLVAVACLVDQRMHMTGYERDDVTALLNEQTCKPSLCIEGTLLFCLVSTSSLQLLEEIANYANEEIEDIYDKRNMYENPHWHG